MSSSGPWPPLPARPSIQKDNPDGNVRYRPPRHTRAPERRSQAASASPDVEGLPPLPARPYHACGLTVPSCRPRIRPSARRPFNCPKNPPPPPLTPPGPREAKDRR
ncbi:uncharacterized protein [Penaeus vannamei]|uniref:uncharacterized protein n=1 Tax=Penaeus vannamei TaxID=6689 RepID=UPI00387F74B5